MRVVVALLALAAVVTPNMSSAPRADAADPSPYAVTITPASGLTDGQNVAINVKAIAGFYIGNLTATVCRLGPAYSSPVGVDPAGPIDSASGFANCPDHPVSSSADTSTFAARPDATTRPEGVTMAMHVGVGTVAWTNLRTREAESLTCDPQHPCAMVVRFKYTRLATPTAPLVQGWIASPHQLSFLDDDPITGCGGVAPGGLATGGSSRMTDAWINWTLDACRRPGQNGALTRGIFTGEGESLTAYTAGSLDLTYAAAGYDPAAGLVPPGSPSRSSVAVPIGLNAAVIAVPGGQPDELQRIVPYRNIKLTTPEVARLLTGHGQSFLTDQGTFFARNPEFNSGGIFYNPNALTVAAASNAETTSWLMTNYVDRLAPSEWKVPNDSTISAAGQRRTVTASLGLADPTFNRAIDLKSARTLLRRIAIDTAGPGGGFILTDLETAKAFSMAPALIQNANGDYVRPTEETLDAAVPTMVSGADGIKRADLLAASSSGAQPYPLTFVEYALVPAEPMYDATCAKRDVSQAHLTDWLTYITTTGQAQLPDGMYKLTPELAAQARDAIAKVGAAPVTGPCAPRTTTTTTAPPTTATTAPGLGGGDNLPFNPANPTGLGAPGFGSNPGSGPDASGSVGGRGSGSGPGVGSGSEGSSSFGAAANGSPGAAAAPGASRVTTTTSRPTEPSATIIPEFAGSRAPNLLVSFGALVAVVVLLSLTALASAGRRPGGAAAADDGDVKP